MNLKKLVKSTWYKQTVFDTFQMSWETNVLVFYLDITASGGGFADILHQVWSTHLWLFSQYHGDWHEWFFLWLVCSYLGCRWYNVNAKWIKCLKSPLVALIHSNIQSYVNCLLSSLKWYALLPKGQTIPSIFYQRNIMIAPTDQHQL